MPDLLTAKALREKRAPLAVKIRELADKANNESRDFTAEEKPNWEAVNKDYDTITRQIELAERAEKVGADQTVTSPESRALPGRDDVDSRDDAETREQEENSDELTDEELGINARSLKPEVFALAMQGWMRARSGLEVEQRHIKAAKQANLNLRRKHLDINLSDTRSYRHMRAEHRTALSAIDGTSGGTTVRNEFVSNFERAMLAYGGMRDVAEVIRTQTGAELTWPTVDDTSNEGHIVGENTTVTDTGVTTGARTWSAYKFTSDLIKVPQELLEDSAFDLVSVIGEFCGERIGRGSNRKYTVGTGSGQPSGIVTSATSGVTAASATAVAADELISLIHSVDPAYRLGSRFMFNDSTLLAIRKLKDGNGKYLFQDNPQLGQPDLIHGYPYTINQHVASIATGAKAILFGQFSKYKIRDVSTLRMRRLVERFADTDQEGFVAFFRTDGGLLDAGQHPVKFITQA